MPFELPKLPYSYDSLEPHIDAKTMEVHHTKHHQGYVDKLNSVLKDHDDLAGQSIEELLGDLDALPGSVRAGVRNMGGGHANHSLFWKTMAPPGRGGGGQPSGQLLGAIKDIFESFEEFKKEFSETAVSRFGSGWAWLVVGENGLLAVNSTANQDSPLSVGQTPILGLDVWEHAYYLKYQNKRLDYISAWWNVVNWPEVGRNLKAA